MEWLIDMCDMTLRKDAIKELRKIYALEIFANSIEIDSSQHAK